MAIVHNFKRGDRAPHPHRTNVDCTYFVRGSNGEAELLQLDTYGSSDREQPGKQSQTIQLTRESAQQLYNIIGREFGFGN